MSPADATTTLTQGEPFPSPEEAIQTTLEAIQTALEAIQTTLEAFQSPEHRFLSTEEAFPAYCHVMRRTQLLYESAT